MINLMVVWVPGWVTYLRLYSSWLSTAPVPAHGRRAGRCLRSWPEFLSASGVSNGGGCRQALDAGGSAIHSRVGGGREVAARAPMTALLDGATASALEPVLYRFALRATRDPEVARDLTQEALLAAVARGASFEGRSSLRTWMIGILAHKIADHFRSCSTRPFDGDDDPALLDAASAVDLERTLIARQELGRVERALGELPARERLAVLMTDVEAIPRDEVARALGLTPTHLRVTLHRARNRMRRALEHDR